MLPKHLVFILSQQKNFKTVIFTTSNVLYYLILHIKASASFSLTQLNDLLCYDLPTFDKHDIIYNTKISENIKNLIVYNFFHVFTQQRALISIFKNNFYKIFLKIRDSSAFVTIFDLFSNANWLEREVGELHNIKFFGKKDSRNLLLQYGDTSFPMLKTFPSVGTRDIYYDAISDLLVQMPTTLQY